MVVVSGSVVSRCLLRNLFVPEVIGVCVGVVFCHVPWWPVVRMGAVVLKILNFSGSCGGLMTGWHQRKWWLRWSLCMLVCCFGELVDCSLINQCSSMVLWVGNGFSSLLPKQIPEDCHPTHCRSWKSSRILSNGLQFIWLSMTWGKLQWIIENKTIRVMKGVCVKCILTYVCVWVRFSVGEDVIVCRYLVWDIFH